MAEFKVGDKVRVNEGLLEGQTGHITGIDVQENLTYVSLEDVAFGGGDLAFYTDTLVDGNEPHEALRLVKLYPERLKGDHWYRVSIWVGDIQYISNTQMDGALLLRMLQKPPAGLCAVEYIEKATASKGDWKALWIEP